MIVVTGGNGFLGSHIVKLLTEKGYPVRVLVRNIPQVKSEGRLNGLEIDYAEGDVTRPESLTNTFTGASAVIHTVAIAVEKGGLSYEQVNTRGTKNVLAYAMEAGVTRFLNVSQLGADSQIPYRFLASKGKAEELVTQSSLDWTTFKPSVIWGPEDEFVNTFVRLAKMTPFIFPIIDKSAKFQPVYVDDVAKVIIKSLDDNKTIGNIYELGGPEILTLYEIERRSLTAAGISRAFIPFPKSLLNIIVQLFEKLLPSPPVTSSLLELLAIDNVTNSNDIYQFVSNPLYFTPENAASYMKDISLSKTIKQYLGK